MFGIDERRHASGLLRLGDDVKRERGFSAGFRAEDFTNAPPRHASAPQGNIEAERSR